MSKFCIVFLLLYKPQLFQILAVLLLQYPHQKWVIANAFKKYYAIIVCIAVPKIPYVII